MLDVAVPLDAFWNEKPDRLALGLSLTDELTVPGTSGPLPAQAVGRDHPETLVLGPRVTRRVEANLIDPGPHALDNDLH
jgi:hypothetical protein